MFQKSNTAFYYLFSDLLIQHVKYYEIGMNTASMQITKRTVDLLVPLLGLQNKDSIRLFNTGKWFQEII